MRKGREEENEEEEEEEEEGEEEGDEEGDGEEEEEDEEEQEEDEEEEEERKRKRKRSRMCWDQLRRNNNTNSNFFADPIKFHYLEPMGSRRWVQCYWWHFFRLFLLITALIQ